MIRQILIASALLGSAGPLAAQTPAPGGPAAPGPSAPPPAGPGAASTDAGAADPQAERQRNSAAKLAGMIRFVAVSCPDAQPDYERFKAVISAMRVDIKDLENGPLLGTSLGYSQAYQKEPEASCQRAFEHFGENGTTIPRLLARKPAAPADAAKPSEPAGPAETPKPAEPK